MLELAKFVGANEDGDFWNEDNQSWGSLRDATRYTVPELVPQGRPIEVWDAVAIVLGRVVSALYNHGLLGAEYGAYIASVTNVSVDDIALAVQLVEEIRDHLLRSEHGDRPSDSDEEPGSET